MFVPVQIRLGAGGEQRSGYDRQLELTERQMVAFEHAAGDMTEPLAAIGADLRTNVAAQFATQGAAGATGRWQVLSEPYGAWKSKHSAAPILVGLQPTGQKGQRPQTYKPGGQMRRELLNPLATHVSPRRLLWAPDSNIAGFHETGTEKMPARPPVDLTLRFLHSVDRSFVVWLGGLMDKLGLSGPGSRR